MALKVYERGMQLGNTVVCNDAFFNAKTFLGEDKKVRELLLKIDDAERLSAETFLDNKHKEWGGIFKNYLSTGMKTVLNIISYKDICFDTLECGANVLGEILCLENGMIVYTPALLQGYFGRDCDIEYYGEHFDKIGDFLAWRDTNVRI